MDCCKSFKISTLNCVKGCVLCTGQKVKVYFTKSCKKQKLMFIEGGFRLLRHLTGTITWDALGFQCIHSRVTQRNQSHYRTPYTSYLRKLEYLVYSIPWLLRSQYLQYIIRSFCYSTSANSLMLLLNKKPFLHTKWVPLKSKNPPKLSLTAATMDVRGDQTRQTSNRRPKDLSLKHTKIY